MDARKPDCTINENTNAKGTLKSKGDIEIRGRMDGGIESEGRVTIAAAGVMTGTVTAEETVMEGLMEGRVEARSLIRAAAGSRINSDLIAPRLSVREGALLNGYCVITPDAAERERERKKLSEKTRQSAPDAVPAGAPPQPSPAPAAANPGPPPSSSVSTETPKNAAGKPPVRKTLSAGFPNADKVGVIGDFNQWDANNPIGMEKKPGGQWTVDLDLSPGRYEYLFVVDGQHRPDPGNPVKSANSFGGENSVLEIS